MMTEPSRSAGAQTAQKPNAAKNYFKHHSSVAKSTFFSQLNRPISSFFTCAVIGIALVLPCLLMLVLVSIQSVSQNWDGSAQITLVLNKDMTTLDAGVLANDIGKKQSIHSSRFIDKDIALDAFRKKFEFADAIDFLDENPLPHVIVVSPNDAIKTVEHIEQLKNSLLTNPEIDSALLDVMWVQRLNSITQMLERAIWIIASMLALSVILVLGNTIRLAIESRKEEIIVVKLVGGTDHFVRRPFLYMGTFYGLGGSILAWILIQIVIYLLNQPIQELASSYQSDFSLSGMNFESTLFLLLLGVSLGWFGSWIAVKKHLSDIEPD